jgi:NitT/TauT family transport system substrate-binding protein
VRGIGNSTVGSNDLYWYVKADSPIKSLKDATDTTTIAYSTTGSSTNMLVLGFLKTYNLKSQPAKIGNPPTTLTAVMSGTGRYRVGRAAVRPQGDRRRQDQDRRPRQRGAIDAQPDCPPHHRQCRQAQEGQGVIERFLTAFNESIDYMYANP